MIEERRILFADRHDLEELPETNYCSRVAAKIFKLLLGFRSWKFAHGESDWIKASVAWVCEKLVFEHPPKMIRRALNLLVDLGIVDRVLSSEARIKEKARWKNPALTWFYQIKIYPNDRDKSTQTTRENIPKDLHILPKSSKNQEPPEVVKILEFPRKRGKHEITTDMAESGEIPLIDKNSDSIANIPPDVDQKNNGQDFEIVDIDTAIGSDLSHDQLLLLESERQAELEEIEDLGVKLHPKILRLILGVDLERLKNAIAAMRQQLQNKLNKGDRIKEPSGFLEMAILKGFKPNKKANAFNFNGANNCYKPEKKLISLNSLWRTYNHSLDDFIEAGLHFGHSEESIKVFLNHK
ncbi:MAG: hypothetical protein WB539_10630 [Planktothrix agardhii]|uniref:hypothetical protein n=1 Tax=Planktothrix agardhii TaxID=1160 RepID=UPI003C57C493